jgi:DNA-binding transcriptional MerR regulator
MAKKSQHYAEAERLYVSEYNTITQISEKLGVSERALIYWKAEGNWDSKKSTYQENAVALHGELYDLARTLTKSIKKSLDGEAEPSAHQLYTLTKLIPLLTKTKEYEDTTTDPETIEQPKGITDDTKKKIRALFGLE